MTEIETEMTTQLAVVEEKTAETQIDHEMIAIETADETTVSVTTKETGIEKEIVIVN